MNDYNKDVIFTNTFKKDLKKVIKQGKNIDKLLDVIDMLVLEKKLDFKYKNHKLIDNKAYKNCFECHIEPDWLLIYQKDDNNIVLIDTGSHSKILNK